LAAFSALQVFFHSKKLNKTLLNRYQDPVGNSLQCGSDYQRPTGFLAGVACTWMVCELPTHLCRSPKQEQWKTALSIVDLFFFFKYIVFKLDLKEKLKQQ
jgi:hypothetical protein